MNLLLFHKFVYKNIESGISKKQKVGIFFAVSIDSAIRYGKTLGTKICTEFIENISIPSKELINIYRGIYVKK